LGVGKGICHEIMRSLIRLQEFPRFTMLYRLSIGVASKRCGLLARYDLHQHTIVLFQSLRRPQIAHKTLKQ